MVGVVWPYLYTCPFLLLFQSVSEEGTERVEIFSDEDEDFSSPEEGSDSEPMLDDQVSHTRRLMSGRKARGLGAGKSNAAAARQRNLKQKFVSLLKKFKVTDPEELDQEQANLDQKISGMYHWGKIHRNCDHLGTFWYILIFCPIVSHLENQYWKLGH